MSPLSRKIETAVLKGEWEDVYVALSSTSANLGGSGGLAELVKHPVPDLGG